VVLGQNTLSQAAGAVADKTPVTFNRMCRKAQMLQTGIRGAGNIGQRVQKRAVEIEKYGLKVDCIILR
jgi:phosphoglycerate dehydrogenase-like enzyme